MKECSERVVKVGFRRNPKRIFDEVESVSALMIKQGWVLRESFVEDGLGNVHLLFEREIDCSKV